MGDGMKYSDWCFYNQAILGAIELAAQSGNDDTMRDMWALLVAHQALRASVIDRGAK